MHWAMCEYVSSGGANRLGFEPQVGTPEWGFEAGVQQCEHLVAEPGGGEWKLLYLREAA